MSVRCILGLHRWMAVYLATDDGPAREVDKWCRRCGKRP